MGTTTSSTREDAGAFDDTLHGEEDSIVPIGAVKDVEVGSITDQRHAERKAERYVAENPHWEWNGQWTNERGTGVIGVRRVARRLEEAQEAQEAHLELPSSSQRMTSGYGGTLSAPSQHEGGSVCVSDDTETRGRSRHRMRPSAMATAVLAAFSTDGGRSLSRARSLSLGGGSLHGSRHGSLHGSRHDSLHGSRHGSLYGSRHGSLYGSRHGGGDTLVDTVSGRSRASSADSGGIFDGPVDPKSFHDTLDTLDWYRSEGSPAPSRESETMRGRIFNRETILDNTDSKDAPRTSEGHGVRLSIPSRSTQGRIGPIMVEETTELVDSNDDSVFVLTQVVRCLPSPSHFEEPLTLDFVVKDDRVRWWNEAAVRKEVLREYQILIKQDEADRWQEMDPTDLSVVWDDQGFTCLRARIKHFSLFGRSNTTKKKSAVSVSHHWDESAVLVVNSTASAAHVTQMPVSFDKIKEGTKAFSLTFCESVGVSFEDSKKTERIMLPVNRPSEIIPAGGATTLLLTGGAKGMHIIICFLPDREASVSPPSAKASSASLGASPATGSTSSSPVPAVSPRNAAPSSGGLPPQAETERVVYCMTKPMIGRRRLTLLQPAADEVSVNNTITIERNAQNSCALETYAMKLANIGTPAS